MTERFIPKGIYTTPEAPVVRKAPIAELTPSASWGYAGGGPRFNRGGDIFMPEQVRGEAPKSNQPTNLESFYRSKNIDPNTLPVEVRAAFQDIFKSGVGGEGPSSQGKIGGEQLMGSVGNEKPSFLPSESVLQKASEMSGGMASAAEHIRELGKSVAAGMNEKTFQEQSQAVRKQLLDLLVPTKTFSGSEKQQYDEMLFQLGCELTRVAGKYKPEHTEEKVKNEQRESGKELGLQQEQETPADRAKREAEQHMRPLRTAYRVLDELLGESNKDEDWQRRCAEQYDIIDSVINGIDFAEGGSSIMFEAIVQESLADGRAMADIQGNPIVPPPPDRKEMEHYGYALEYAIERIIGQGDINPTADYPQFGFYQQNNLDELIQSSRKYNEGFYIYLINLRGKRALSHMLFQNLKDRKTLVELVTRSLDPGGMRFIEDEIAGVPEVLAFYEKELGRLTGSNSYEGKGWVQFDDYRDIADKTVQSMVNHKLGLERDLKSWVQDPNTGQWVGKVIYKDGRRVRRRMRDWEKSRAFNMARANTGATLRRQIWGFYGDNPDNIPDLVKSLEGGEQITMLMAPLARLDNRYFSQPGSQMFLDNWVERKIVEGARQDKRYSLKRNGKEYGLYGASVKSTVLLDTGVVDVKSSGWRNDLMFLRQKEYGVAENLSIDEFFNQKKKELHEQVISENSKFSVLSERVRDYRKDTKLKHELGHEVSHRFNHWLEHSGFLSDQRLFLGVLAKRSDITWENKMALWHTTADLLPSRIASLMPQFSMDEVKAVFPNESPDRQKEIWDEIQRKLFLAEHDRVQADAEGLKWIKRRGNDGVERLVRANPNYKPQRLEEYLMQRGDMTPGEQRVVQRWQKLGHDMAMQLSQMVWPHTPFLDDVPRTAWANMGRNELDRLLINDHNDWQEAYGQITGLVGNPAIPASKLPEIFHTFVEHAKSPESLSEAQGRVESFIYTWCMMVRKYKVDRFTQDILTVLPKRRATSRMMEINLSSGLSKNEEEIAGNLVSYANLEILSDDPSEVDQHGWTQLIRLMHELNADRKNITVWNVYDWFTLAIFTLMREGLDAVIPDEVVKAA